MMSILMLGLISAGGGVGVATFSQDQQGGLTQTTGGAGLREAVTIENTEIISTASNSTVNIVVRNTGSVNVDIGSVYFDGVQQVTDSTVSLAPGGADTIDLEIEGTEVIGAGTTHTIKVTTEGGGVVTTTVTAPQ